MGLAQRSTRLLGGTQTCRVCAGEKDEEQRGGRPWGFLISSLFQYRGGMAERTILSERVLTGGQNCTEGPGHKTLLSFVTALIFHKESKI